MRTYDLESVTKAFYERQNLRFRGRPPWDEVVSYVQADWRGIVSDAVICYERHLEEIEEQAKREGRKGER